MQCVGWGEGSAMLFIVAKNIGNKGKRRRGKVHPIERLPLVE